MLKRILFFCLFCIEVARACCGSLVCPPISLTVSKLGPDLYREEAYDPYIHLDNSSGMVLAYVCKYKVFTTAGQTWYKECDTHFVEQEILDTLGGMFRANSYVALCRIDSLHFYDQNDITCPQGPGPEMSACVKTSSPIRYERIRITMIQHLKGSYPLNYIDTTIAIGPCDAGSYRTFFGKSVLLFFGPESPLSTIKLAGACVSERGIFIVNDTIHLKDGSHRDSVQVPLSRFLETMGVATSSIRPAFKQDQRTAPRIVVRNGVWTIQSPMPIISIAVFRSDGRLIAKQNPNGRLEAEIGIPNCIPGTLFAQLTVRENGAERKIPLRFQSR